MTASVGTAAAVEDARLLDHAVSMGKDVDRSIAETVTKAQEWATAGYYASSLPGTSTPAARPCGGT